MLKLIEQFAKMVAQLLQLDFIGESQVFEDDFDALLKAYFKLKPEELALLLEENQDRDGLLLDEHSKNAQLSLFARAGLVFIQKNEIQKAQICLKITARIQKTHAALYEFPNEELRRIENEIALLSNALNDRD